MNLTLSNIFSFNKSEMKGYFFRFNLIENIKYEDILYYYNMVNSYFDIEYFDVDKIGF